ncbi:hypothetical protein PVAP13_9KG170900 [Panicum virgatum]|uniref:Amino acid transporter transmembrane domain-containing protein n=1 Tax=Panicum virgatum TaxID=38727 RepID=A0A8T0NKL0_PANVG|nr:hypothetical protein PVAP13_9KG170900 [Panicum virgatum]
MSSPATARGGGGEAGVEQGGRGTWRHAAFHVATTIATPAAYAPLPFAVASLGWPLGVCSLVIGTLVTWCSSLVVASLWQWNGEKHTSYRLLAKSIFGYRIDRKEVSYSLQGNTATKIFRAFNALGTIAFSFGDAMLPEIQSTVREPVRKNMYKGVSAAYTIIVMSYWTLAFSGYWAFGSQVPPYILSSLTAPRWAIVMANVFAVIQIAGCFQIYCRPTFAHFEERVQAKNRSCRSCLWRLMYTSAYMAVITLVSAAMPFFGDFVSICGAVGFTPLDFVLPGLALLKTSKLPDNLGSQYAVKVLSAAVAVMFSIIGVLACIGAIRSITLDVRTYKFFHDM